MMKRFLLITVLLFWNNFILSQSLYFPPVNGSEWQTLSFNSLGWDSTKTDTLYKFLQANNTKAFLLLKNGKIVIEKYFDTFTRDSIWYWASAGKTLTSFLVGLAQQDGYLSINDSTSKYLGRWTSAPLNKESLIKIKHQLSMTSGLNDNVPDPYCTLQSCLIYHSDAGTRWAYHNGPYTLLDSVIQKATGQNLNQYFINKLRIKSGMTGLYIRSGFNNVFFSTPRSMARFGLLILNKGKWDTTTIMSDTIYFNQMINTSQSINKSYGYLWWLNGKESYMLPQTQLVFPGYLCPNAPADMIAALGKNGQFLNVVPSQNLIFVRMGNAPDTVFVPTLLNNDIWKLLNPIISTSTSISNELNKLNTTFFLEQNFPNPFNSGTKIKFFINERSYVQLKVFNIMGKEIATLDEGEKEAGIYEIDFSPSYSENFKILSSGVFFYQLRVGNFIQVKKMIYLR